MSGPITERLAEPQPRRHREQLDAVARAITAVGDLSGWEYADLAQLHYMAMELAAATNRVLAEREEPHE